MSGSSNTKFNAPVTITIQHPGGTSVITVAAPPVVTQPPATGKVESADLTMVPPSASIVDSWQRTLTIVGGKAVIDGVPVAATSGVVLLKKIDHPVTTAPKGVYQKTDTGDWYGPFSPNSLGTQVAGDPSAAAPPVTTVPPVVTQPAAGVPAPAASVGYDKRTLGPELTLGRNWFPCDFYSDPNGQHITQVSGGVLRFAGGSNGFNAHACTTKKDGTGPTFGNGAYFEATLGWENVYSQNDGWPSWWANQIGMMRGDGDGIELDFMEWWSNTNFGTCVHHWSPNGGHVADGGSFDMAAGFNHAAQHKYGCLWVPATTGTQGYVEMFLDGRPLKRTSYSKGVGDWAVTDTDAFALILGSNSNNPMTVTRAEVWQR